MRRMSLTFTSSGATADWQITSRALRMRVRLSDRPKAASTGHAPAKRIGAAPCMSTARLVASPGSTQPNRLTQTL